MSTSKATSTDGVLTRNKAATLNKSQSETRQAEENPETESGGDRMLLGVEGGDMGGTGPSSSGAGQSTDIQTQQSLAIFVTDPDQNKSEIKSSCSNASSWARRKKEEIALKLAEERVALRDEERRKKRQREEERLKRLEKEEQEEKEEREEKEKLAELRARVALAKVDEDMSDGEKCEDVFPVSHNDSVQETSRVTVNDWLDKVNVNPQSKSNVNFAPSVNKAQNPSDMKVFNSRLNDIPSASHQAQHTQDPPYENLRSRPSVPQSAPESTTNEILKMMAESLHMQASNALRVNNKINDLPFFDGTIEDWPRFYAEFYQSTTEYKINETQNLGRLQKCLKGRALDAVRALLIHPGNVPRIIEHLKMRFGRPELIIETMKERVRNLRRIDERHLEQVVEYASTVENLVTTIESFDRRGYLMDTSLLRELEVKLPPFVLGSWGMYRARYAEVNLRTFSNWLHSQAEGFCCFITSDKVTEKPKSDKDNVKSAKSINSVSENSEKSEPVKSYKSGCANCEMENHKIFNCIRFKKMNIEERWKLAKAKRLCFQCLGSQHQVKDCKHEKCPVNECGRRHNKLLHDEERFAQFKKREAQSNESTLQIHENKVRKILMKIIPVVLTGPRGSIHTHAFIDEGSSTTLLCEKVAKRLGLNGVPQNLCVSTFDGREQSVKSQRVEVGIRGITETQEFVLKNVRTHPLLKCPTQSLDYSKLRANWGLPDWDVSSYERAAPSILIGLDNAYLVCGESENCEEGPIVQKTKLGFIVHGPDNGLLNEGREHISTVIENDDLHQLVKKFFSTEEFGVKVPESLNSSENQRALSIMEKTTQRVEGGWETGLLWQEDSPNLPESKMGAMHRLKSIENKMRKNQDFEKKYVEKIQELKEKGFVRKVSGEDKIVPGKTWYLPHFHALNPKKPEKIRLVFDAAAVINGTSLNNNLLQGPDFYTSLPKILLKFRQYRVAFLGDIKDMFHRVKIIKSDLQAQRFLFRSEEDPNKVEELLMSVMIFGAKCSPASAQYVKNRNAQEFVEEFPESVRAIIDKHYVDDYLDSVESTACAKKRIEEVSTIHQRGGFTICNWLSNEEEALEDVPDELRGKKKISEIKEESERVLGLYWKVSEDVFTYPEKFDSLDPEVIVGGKIPTKREVLKVLMTIFDPLGIIAHFTVGAKIILQEIWRSGVGWSDEIQQPQYEKWRKWVFYLGKICELNLPRCYEPRVKSAQQVQLHVFVDASQLAFCAVAYLRFVFEGEISTSLVMGKTRVAPLKPISIPRLELQAAVMGSRLASTIKEALEFEISETYYWSDSMTVLKWLKADPLRFKVFVANRIGEILESTKVNEWRWVPTKLNVADEATRGEWEFKFEKGARWYTGPEFLCQEQCEWPEQPEFQHVVLESNELKEENFLVSESAPIIKFERFGSWLKMLRVLAYVKRFLCVKKFRVSGPISVDELQQAEMSLWKIVHQDSFPQELKCCAQKKPIDKESFIFKLSPHIINNENILRVKGRLAKSKELPEETKFPIILHPAHRATRLLMQYYHEVLQHQGFETVLVELRQKYWIVQGRNSLRSVINDCRVCQLKKLVPIPQEMGELPAVRSKRPSRAFMFVGLDYFGPLESVVGRRREKRWVALFTCLSIRAVHLELVNSLSTDSTIMAIRRFCARRGNPSDIYSDNGTNFVGSDTELQKSLNELKQEDIINDLSTKGIRWHFIPPGAPHMGGAWESLVKSVKMAMGSTLLNSGLQDEKLLTVLAEAERIVNSRPITYVSSAPDDDKCLTPNDFLLTNDVSNPLIGVFDESDMSVRKCWRRTQYLAEKFWVRWQREYLPMLNKRSKWLREGRMLKEGDLVFIIDENQPRGVWVKGVIEQTFPGTDGQVRVVNVRTTKGVYKRPVSKLMVPGSTD